MADSNRIQFDQAETLFTIIQTCGDCPTGRRREQVIDELAEYWRNGVYDPTCAAMPWVTVIDAAMTTDPEAPQAINRTTRRALALDLEDTYREQVQERASAGIVAAHYPNDASRPDQWRGTCYVCSAKIPHGHSLCDPCMNREA